MVIFRFVSCNNDGIRPVSSDVSRYAVVVIFSPGFDFPLIILNWLSDARLRMSADIISTGFILTEEMDVYTSLVLLWCCLHRYNTRGSFSGVGSYCLDYNSSLLVNRIAVFVNTHVTGKNQQYPVRRLPISKSRFQTTNMGSTKKIPNIFILR